MSDLESIDTILIELIENDLKRQPDIEYNRDALGATIYLYFLLKNKITSAELDSLVDWVNAWVDNILNKELFSRFLDRELTSALFGFYVLRQYSKLRIELKENVIENLVARFAEANAFFGNLTYSIMDLLSVSDYRDRLPQFGPALDWVRKQMDNGTILNDGKNLAFASMLFKKVDSARNTDLIRIAFRKMHDRTILFNDQLYYAWLLWNSLSEFDKKDVPRIREFVESAMMSLRSSLKPPIVRDEELSSEYGQNGQSSMSKIQIGFYLDLLRSFTSNTVRISKKELESTPVFARVGGLIGFVLCFVDFIAAYLALTNGIFQRLPASVGLAIGARIVLIDLFGFIGLVVLFAAGASIFWDTAVKGIVSNKIVVTNLRKRELENLKYTVICGVFVGIISAMIV